LGVILDTNALSAVADDEPAVVIVYCQAASMQPVARHARASQPAQPSELEAFAQPLNGGYPVLASCILTLTCVSTPPIQGRSRVR
jgi:hypothetical protein